MSRGRDKAIRVCVNRMLIAPGPISIPLKDGVRTVWPKASLGIYAILTIRENTDGTIMVALRARGPSETYDGLSPEETRCSIHPSDGSPNKIATIKFTQTFGGQPEATFLFTKAARTQHMFCPVFAQQCAALSHEDDKKTPGVKNIILDSIDNRLALFYALEIAEPKGEPLWTNIDYMNISRLEFSRFSLFIMYTYQTFAPDYDWRIMKFGGEISGFDAYELNKMVNNQMKELLHSRKALISSTLDDPKLVDIIYDTTFIKSGTVPSIEYQKWRSEIIKNRSIDPQAIQITGGPTL